MSAFLGTVKVATNARVTIGTLGLRNLGIDVGDEVDILFDETAQVLIIRKVTPSATIAVKSRAKGKKNAG